MEQAKPADLFVDALLTADRVGADRRDLHIMEPLNEFRAIFKARFIVIRAGREESLRTLFIVAVEPSGVDHQDIVLFDRDSLLPGGGLQIRQADGFAAVEMLLALIPGGVQQNAAADYTMLGNGLNRALLQPSNGGRRIIAVVEMVTIPGVPERIVLSGAL